MEMTAFKEEKLIPKLLVLSDLHYTKENEGDIRRIFDSFLETFSAFIGEHPKWTPDCLLFAGDIAKFAKEDEYGEAKKMIDLIKAKIHKDLYVLSVPGNHDKNVTCKLQKKTAGEEPANKRTAPGTLREDTGPSEEELAKKDIEQTKTFFKNCARADWLKKQLETAGDDNKKKELEGLQQNLSDYVEKYFGAYTRFVTGCGQTADWTPIPDVLPGNRPQRINGIYKIDKLKLCVLALNTEWKYARKNAGQKESILTLGETFIQQMEKPVQLAKRDGYTVITLMHRSPYRLCWEDIYGSSEGNSPVARIIQMSDLIICGHEHNKKRYPPDLLWNTTQLYQNGALFTDSADEGIYPYAAALIRINPYARIMKVAEFRINVHDMQKWTVPNKNTIYDYYLDTILDDQQQYVPKNPLYKEVTLHYLPEPRTLRPILLRLFYPYDKYRPQEIHIPHGLGCKIMKLDGQSREKFARWINRITKIKENTKQNQAAGKPFPSRHVILYCERSNVWATDKTTQEALTRFKEIRQLIRNAGMDQLSVNLIFCNILDDIFAPPKN